MKVYRYSLRITEAQKKALRRLSVEHDSINHYLGFLIDREAAKLRRDA